jgi:hypothetical protein
MESLISDFTEKALKRSKQMSDEEFERTVKESHEIIDRRVSPARRRESA